MRSFGHSTNLFLFLINFHNFLKINNKILYENLHNLSFKNYWYCLQLNLTLLRPPLIMDLLKEHFWKRKFDFELSTAAHECFVICLWKNHKLYAVSGFSSGLTSKLAVAQNRLATTGLVYYSVATCHLSVKR